MHITHACISVRMYEGNYTEQKAITLLILAKKQPTNYLQVVISKPVLKLTYHRMNITHGLYRKIHLKLF